MKKYLLYALGLVLVSAAALLAFDALCVALVRQSQGTTMYKMYRLFVDHPADEIPIFGSSRANSNYAPSEISPKAFCYGIDGSGMDETLFLVENYLRENPTGGPIIINFDPWGFPKPHEGGFMADYTLSPIAPEPQCSVLGVRMVGKLREIVAAWLNQHMAVTKRIDHGAILQLVNRTKAEWDFINAQEAADWHFYVDDMWRKRVTALATGSNRTLVWVVGPCAPRKSERFVDGGKLQSWLEELKSMPNTVVINLYDMECPESLCMDATHLNETGACKFSTDLKKILQ